MSIRILAVDDSPTMRGLIGAALTPSGFDVRFAEDGIDGDSNACPRPTPTW